MFQLEVLKAKYGDCLILHHGDDDAPCRILIDGGPASTYDQALAPRLAALQAGREPLWIDLLIVSHIDNDHIGGVNKLFDEVDNARVEHRAALATIDALWHNSFPDIIAQPATAAGPAAGGAGLQVAGLVAALPDLGIQHQSRLVLEGVAQGRTLRQQAERNAVSLNPGFDGGLVLAGETKVFDDLRLVVLGPTRTDVEALQAEWAEKVREILKQKGARAVAAAQSLDTSIANLSSLVVLAQQGDRRMLLTGDARGDKILNGLREAGLLDHGPLHVDLLKWPHHGSIRNIPPGFFRHIVADHHVVSADGHHGNPDLETFERLFAECPRRRLTLHMTYGPDDLRKSYPVPELKAIFAKARADGHDFTIHSPPATAQGLSIDL